MAEKRGLSPEASLEESALVLKRQKVSSELAIVGTVTREGIVRTSNLHAPIMRLYGHGGEVYTLRFSPDGKTVASGSFDRSIFFWKTYGEECENYMALKGHKNAVLEVQWFTNGEVVLSCSADKTVRAWDVEVGQQVKKLTEHTGIVNSVHPLRRGPAIFVSGSDDRTVKVWDMRMKRSVQTLEDGFQVTCVAFSDAGDQVLSGGIDMTIKVWDLRKGSTAIVLRGHSDVVTGMRLSPDGTHLLSNAMDNTLRMWDIRPFAPVNRCVKVFTGHQHNFEQLLLRCDWSPDGSKVTAGSADRFVYVWETESRKLLYKLPGHLGSVNESIFHPTEPIIGSASSDKTIYLGELGL